MIPIPELQTEADDVYDFNEVAGEALTEFCEDLERQGETRPITEDDEADETWKYLWTDKAIRLIDAEIDRLYEIGRKYFGDTLEPEISSYMYKEL